MNILNEPTQGLIVPTKICYFFNAKYENFGSLARNQLYMFSGTYCKKKKKKKKHTINYYGKSGYSRTPDPRQGLYTRNWPLSGAGGAGVTRFSVVVDSMAFFLQYEYVPAYVTDCKRASRNFRILR